MGKVVTHNKLFAASGVKKQSKLLYTKPKVYKNTSAATPIFNLPSALHEWNYQNVSIVSTTTTQADTGSVGALDMTNPDAASQPDLSFYYLNFNGTTQGVKRDTSSFRNSDTSGVFHFKFFKITGTAQILWQGANSSVSDEFINITVFTTGEVNFTMRVGGTFLSLISNATLVDNAINTVSIYSNGSDAFMIFNGTKITSFSSDTLTSYWLKRFFDIGGTISNISLAVRYSSTIIYTNQKHKIGCYTAYSSEANTLTDHDLIRNTTF